MKRSRAGKGQGAPLGYAKRLETGERLLLQSEQCSFRRWCGSRLMCSSWREKYGNSLVCTRRSLWDTDWTHCPALRLGIVFYRTFSDEHLDAAQHQRSDEQPFGCSRTLTNLDYSITFHPIFFTSKPLRDCELAQPAKMRVAAWFDHSVLHFPVLILSKCLLLVAPGFDHLKL